MLWGEQLGAALGNIGAYQGYAAVSDPHGSLLSWTTIEKGGIIVNGAGHRFGDESAGYSGYTPNVMAQGGPCFAIFDQKIFDVTAAEEEFVELANYGGVKKADTPGGARGAASARCRRRRGGSSTITTRRRAASSRTRSDGATSRSLRSPARSTSAASCRDCFTRKAA